MNPDQTNPFSPKGIALVTVLVAVVIVVAIFTTLSASVLSELRNGRTVSIRDELAQSADGLSERARLQLVLDYRSRGIGVPAYIAQVSENPTTTTVDLGNGITGRWRVVGVSGVSAEYGWIEVASTASRGNESQTVVRRVSFGQNDVFKLAMLSETTNCMYCHLRVNGDVGALFHHRPGWGSEGVRGQGSGANEGGSVIRGNLYAARTITNDDTPRNAQGALTRGNHSANGTGTLNAYRINGSLVTGDVESNSTNSALPQDTDGDGIPDFPPIKRAVALASANGSLSGGIIVALNSNQVLNSTTLTAGQVGNISRTHNGNLVLIGTPSNPIVLDKDIYVSGDVVIKGVVRGRGAIYTGRNLYIAGNVTYQNPPSKPGQGICTGVTDPNQCARLNIANGRDELRLAARGNTVVGDYTERDASGNLLPYDLRQSSDFYRAQFGFWGGNRYYDTQNGDELVLRGGRYYNVEGEEITASRVVTRAADQSNPSQDAYSYSFRPGSVDTSGNFNAWISDDFYRNILLGTTNLTYNTWRWGFPSPSGTTAQRRTNRDNIRNQLVAARIPSNAALAIACRLAGISGTSNGCPSSIPGANGGQDLRDNSGNVIGYFHIQHGTTLRVVRDQPLSYETQVTRVDAFLYSNYRIAGKTSMLGTAMNGGLIAKELGILAPGRYKGWWKSSRYNFLSSPTDDRRECNRPGQVYWVADTEDCALTVNYDYRLRNGGYGFNLVVGNPGQTVSWRLSADPSERVR
ncbi:hypothetical protein [Meiothermus sp.]|uniref:hypothetical protein n=1 Tax=Meiothermus sp. TaxID=1955249 RepID=UPI00307F72A9